MTLKEFMKHAADAVYMGDADLLEGYAREVFGERDAAHQEVKRLRDRVNELESPLSYLPPSEERVRAVAAIERAKSEEYRALYLESVKSLKEIYYDCECHRATFDEINMRAHAVIQKAEEERSGGSMRSEFAAAIAALDGMKRERDEARKALGQEKAEMEAFNRENVSLRLRVRELETELQEREKGA